LFPDSSTPLDPILSTEDCFLVMSDFVWAYARRGAGDDLITLLGDTGLTSDGRPFDSAAWEDWVESIEWIKSGRFPRTRESSSPAESPQGAGSLTLTSREGFLAATDFLWEYASRAGDHLLALLDDMTLANDGQSADRRIRRDWLASVDWIRSGNPTRNRF